jgi:membrane protease YdiL (CAAX protease family)
LLNNRDMMNMSFFLFVAFLFPLADLWFYPRLQRATAAGTPGARARYHLIGSASLWLLAGCAVALVLRRQQPWSDLRLDVPSPLRLAAGLALVIAYIAYVMRQRRVLIRKPDRLRALAEKGASTIALVPHTETEVKTFEVLSVSAGVCEEIIYRGFMLWFASMWIGLWPGVLVTSVLFGLAHVYLGKKYIVRTAFGGVLFGVIAVGSASLWPAILLHAFTDLLSGDLSYRAVRT